VCGWLPLSATLGFISPSHFSFSWTIFFSIFSRLA
jgi:hypothetical protein